MANICILSEAERRQFEAGHAVNHDHHQHISPGRLARLPRTAYHGEIDWIDNLHISMKRPREWQGANSWGDRGPVRVMQMVPVGCGRRRFARSHKTKFPVPRDVNRYNGPVRSLCAGTLTI